MNDINLNFTIPNSGLYFMSLGGIGEIGANCYLYSCDGKWLMIDLGISFADEKFPGIDLLVPEMDFLDIIENNLEAVIISHGHEDHAGALPFFIDKIKCPVYASGFTKSLLSKKLKEYGKSNLKKIELFTNESNLNFKNFNLNFISTTHSIPEPYAIVINTKYGKLLHTADWKIDPRPLIGKKFDKNSFEKLSNDNLLALIGDSTNADVSGHSESELTVREELSKIFKRYNKRIVATCFSSNIARMASIAIAAKENNRKVVLVGRSIKRTIEAAKENGYLQDIDNFITEDEAINSPKENLVIICTGSQGEKRSALYRIAYNAHEKIYLDNGDVVIFSSKDIPGNEKSINNLQNLLVRQQIEVITSNDEVVHASGHGYAEEIKEMYNLTKPYVSIPIHGEPKHLLAHSRIAQSSQVPVTKLLDNGVCLKIAPEEIKVHGKIKTGKMIVEGKSIYSSDNNFIKERRKYSFEGIVLVTILINSDYSLDKDIKISFNGLPSENSYEIEQFFKENFLNEYILLNDDKKSSDSIVKNLIKKIIRKQIKHKFNKKPEVFSHIVRL